MMIDDAMDMMMTFARRTAVRETVTRVGRTTTMPMPMTTTMRATATVASGISTRTIGTRTSSRVRCGRRRDAQAVDGDLGRGRAMARGRWNGRERGNAWTIGAVANPLALPDYDEPREETTEGGDSKDPIRVKIGEEWYDCRGWAKAHPGGERWLHFFNGRDATDVFYALHSYGPNGSDLAVKRLQKLPRCDPPKDKSRLPSESSYAVSMAFGELRDKLAEDGFFKRQPLKEAWALFQVVALYASGTALAYSHPIVATILLGLGMEQAGWLGHDYVHGRGPWCTLMRYMPTLLNGHSVEWWMQKHSMHHSFTNEEHLDNDIMMEPFFFLRSPTESGRPDHPLRKFQHIYGYPLLSIMFWLWRWHSVQTAWKRKDVKELAFIGANYLFLATMMPWQVAVGAITLSGFLVGSLVSATHQSEEIMEFGEDPEYVEGQFRSTRDAECVFGGLETWIWGGMDTQLEHHLFPTMPRYNYHKLRPLLKAWAKANGIQYRSSPSTTIIADNFKLLKRVARAA